MFLFDVLTFFKKGDIIQGGTLFKGGHYLRKYGKSTLGPKISSSLNLLSLINVGKLEESTLIDPDLDREYLIALFSSKLPSVSNVLSCA